MIARMVYHWPDRALVLWRRVVGPIPQRRSDGYYSFCWRWPVLWRYDTFTLSTEYPAQGEFATPPRITR